MQWVYTAIAIFVFFLAIVFYLIELPEITDADMQHQAAETHAGEVDQPFRKQYRLFHASFAQFCYTGAQIAIAGYFINYVTETRKNTDSALGARFLAGAQGSFAIGRFVGAAIMHFVRPRKVFLVFLTACIIFIAPSVTQRENTGMSMLYVTLFFESICFPTIMALGMRGLGRHTKRGSGFIVAGVFGGAVVPPLMGAVADMHDTAMSMVVPLAFFVVAWSYALAVNFWPWYRDTCDAFTTADIGVREREDGVVGEISAKAAVDEEEAVGIERQTAGEKGM